MRQARKLRIGVLLGGTSSEHDVSICSGLQVMQHLDPHRYDPIPVFIDRQGSWHFGHLPDAPTLERPRTTSSAAAPQANAISSAAQARSDGADGGVLERLRPGREFDLVFIALHGPGGEDGTVQGLLSCAGMPFTASGVLASALAMDKAMAKQIYRLHAIPTPEHVQIVRQVPESRQRLLDSAHAAAEQIGLPCVVKPVAGGSSFATRIVSSAAQLPAALAEALARGDRVLVERYIDGTEVTCGVLGGGPLEGAMALPVTEIVPADGAFFDFRAKYTGNACEEITPARISEPVAVRVQQLAVKAHQGLGCEGMSRSDFIISSAEPLLLETNTIPGLTAASLLPQAAVAAGITFPELLHRLIVSALRRDVRPAGAGSE